MSELSFMMNFIFVTWLVGAIWYIKQGGGHRNKTRMVFRILSICFVTHHSNHHFWIWISISTNPFCCLVLTVSSKAFAAGADILEMQENPGNICLNE
jgi:hypothetical protein